MKQTDLAALPEPKYLLYPPSGLYQALMAIPVLTFSAYLLWFIPAFFSGQLTFWHWVFIGILGLLAWAVTRPQARDWRYRITFAATPDGAWFVTNSKGGCVFVPWQQVRRVYADSLSSHSGVIKGVVFELDIDDAHWQRLLGGERHRFSLPGRVDGYYRFGLSANLRKPVAIAAEVERFRILSQEQSTSYISASAHRR